MASTFFKATLEMSPSEMEADLVGMAFGGTAKAGGGGATGALNPGKGGGGGGGGGAGADVGGALWGDEFAFGSEMVPWTCTTLPFLACWS